MSFYAYAISPIDGGWESLRTVKETLLHLAEAPSFEDKDINDEVESFIRNWRRAKETASAAGWQGDHRNEPCVFWVPNESEFKYGFVIKQDNNGTTYVISPVPLPHLE